MTENITLNVLKKTEDAMIPIYGSKYAVGMDKILNLMLDKYLLKINKYQVILLSISKDHFHLLEPEF